VEFDTGSETIRGVVKDIADDGALVLITQHGTSMKMITGDMHVTE
jgi:biotin-(acetyl-CoA carboxylase) ligase